MQGQQGACRDLMFSELSFELGEWSGRWPEFLHLSSDLIPRARKHSRDMVQQQLGGWGSGGLKAPAMSFWENPTESSSLSLEAWALHCFRSFLVWGLLLPQSSRSVAHYRREESKLLLRVWSGRRTQVHGPQKYE